MPQHEASSLEHQVRLLKVIADESRLRILGLLATSDLTGKELSERLGMTPPTISHHMRRLTDAGIVTCTVDAQRHVYALNTSLLRETRKAESHPPAPDEKAPDIREKVLRNFFEGDRLKSIPAQRKQRVIVLQKLMERFEPGRGYPEREVNEILKVAHEDVATLRRELVDYGFMVREKGVYEVAETLPPRSPHVAQEITGDEPAWLSGLILESIGRARET